MNDLNKKLLEQGIDELYSRNKIDSNVKTEIESYITNITDKNVYEVAYSEFNQTDSTGVTFDDVAREVDYNSGSAELITNAIVITNIRIDSIKLKGSDENVTYQMSTDGTNWFNIDSFDINEEVITASFYLKVKFSSINTIKGIIVIYENM